MIELLIVVAIIAIIAGLAIPQLLGAREKAWRAACDDNYKGLSGELQNELDTEMAKANPNAATDVLDRVVPRHADVNPRNKADIGYQDNDACGSFVATASTSCRVFLCYQGSNSIEAQQYENGAIRTFAIAVQ